MLRKEDVDSWNDLFPDCQINKTNLSTPSEHFLTNALVVYLRRFGYHIEPPFSLNSESKEHNRENRLFLIKLARQIDNFLKITDKSYSFTYYDLIRPTPKKTAHMLYILLNYYFYYNLYKERVFKMAGDRISKLDELRSLIDNTCSEKELRKEKNKHLKTSIDTLNEKVPMAHAKLEELDKKRTQQKEEIKKLTHSYQELKENLKHLKEQKKLLRKRVVPEEEYEELQKQLQQLKLEIAEHKEVELTNSTNLNECKESNLKLQKLGEEIERAHEILPLHLLKQVQETNKQLTKLEKEEHELQHRQNAMIQEIEEENQTRFSLEEEKHNKTLEFKTNQNALMNTRSVKENIFKQKNTEIQQLEYEAHISECALEEQKDIAQFLEEIWRNFSFL